MRRLLIGLGCAVALMLGPAAASAQPTKNVKGTITAVSASSITVKGPDGDVTLMINGQTRVTSPGGSTATKAARVEGKAGVVVTDILKTGQAVDIDYHEQGMHAAAIRTIARVPTPGASAPKAQTVSGVVSAVSGTSLTVKGTEEWTFTADAKTTVSGAGVGTASKKLTDAGKKPTLLELVHEGDTVSVTFREVDGAKHAAVVRITRRKA
ncbi:MAG: DUF5666 domain-containing protein [Vicinamibacterales bacterium]